MAVVYKITNIINGKIYIGQTSRTIEQRWKEHCSSANSDTVSTYFHSAIKKYGKDNFKKEIIEENICKDIVFDVETAYILSYNSIDKNIGYNTTIDVNHYAKKIDDIQVIKDIIYDIKNTELNFSEIGAKYGLSRYLISSLNRGISYKINEEENYPIRKMNIAKKLNKETVLLIAKNVHETKLSLAKIAEMYDTSEGTVKKINAGTTYYSIVSEKYSFPLRVEQCHEISHDLVENHIYKDLKYSLNLSLVDIANKYGFGVSVISSINKGDSHRKHLEENIGATFPIRDTNMRKRISEETIVDIVELLMYTSLTANEISTYYDTDSNTISRINRGIRYGAKTKKIYNGEFPIRTSGSKKIIFETKEQLMKEKEILNKYNIKLSNK